jgi:hypothetical protein
VEKLDLTKEYKEYYTATTKAEIVKFGEIPYITITGKGEPAGKEFSEKAGALYPVAYGIKKLCKNMDKDFAVPKLEGLWWVESNTPALSVPRSQWYWKLLIRMPEFVTAEMVNTAITEVAKTKNVILAQDVEYEILDEGNIVSILHIGPYSTEPKSIKLMDSLIIDNKYTKNGFHHEIYLSDPNKTAPDKLKTLLRQPVK